MCAADKCRNYNRSWSCPPAIPSLEALREQAARYQRGIIVQTVGQLEDSFDIEGITDTAQRHQENMNRMLSALRSLYPGLYAMGAGGCRRCEKCTYPDAPCRFPEDLTYSMEASGLVVSEVCTANGVRYNYGPNTIAYTSCFLLE